MRGLAAFCVFVEHFALPFQPAMFYAFGGLETSHFLQLPIIRLCYSGSPMVCIFFVISGVALSLKPARLIMERNWDRLYPALGSAMFRRAIRLFGPTLVGSLGIMLGSHSHFYDVQYDVQFEGPASVKASFWSKQAKFIPGFWNQIGDWLRFISSEVLIPNTWRGTGTGYEHLIVFDRVEYGSQFWTIPVEYWSSILLFAAIMGSARIRRTLRLLVLVLLLCFTFLLGRWDFGLFLYGSLLVDVTGLGTQVSVKDRTSHPLMQVFWVLLFFVGLFIASIPDEGFTNTPIFSPLARISKNERLWQSIGAAQVVTTVCQADFLQHIFSASCFVYLGRISYALYIVHLGVLSIIGWRLVPIIWNVTGRETPSQYYVGFGLSFLLLLPVLFWTADTFYRLVDRPFTNFARWLEGYLSDSGAEKGEEPDYEAVPSLERVSEV